MSSKINPLGAKKIIFLSLLFSIGTMPLSAVHYFKGQKEYLDNCRVCHKGSSVFVSKYSVKEWTEFLSNNGVKLRDAHSSIKNDDFKQKDKDKNDIDVNIIKNYLSSEIYVTKLKYYQSFIEQFAKDGKANLENK